MKTGLYILFIASAFLLVTSCENQGIHGKTEALTLIDTTGTTIQTRFSCPEGFTRKKLDSTSFGFYLRYFNLYKAGTSVKLYNGNLKGNQNVHEAVLNISVGKRDLQQCADAVMRLRAEYLFAQKKFDDIHFNFVSGFNCEYRKWRLGYRVVVSGNKVSWSKSAGVDESHASFIKYMETVFTYAGTLSLSKELHPVGISEVKIGDVLIYGGSPGHAVIVMDVCENNKGEKRVMLAQSYMPAQQIHVLKNLNSKDSPWYNFKEHAKIYTPEWTFEKSELKRF